MQVPQSVNLLTGKNALNEYASPPTILIIQSLRVGGQIESERARERESAPIVNIITLTLSLSSLLAANILLSADVYTTIILIFHLLPIGQEVFSGENDWKETYHGPNQLYNIHSPKYSWGLSS